MATPTSEKHLDPALPAELSRLASSPRVRVRRDGPPAPDGKSVVYWMQRSQRGLNNPGIDVACAAANALGLPLIVYFSAINNFPSANLRHYVFLNQGLPNIEEDLAARNITFIVRRPPGNSLEALLDETRAALLIGDENPCREPERWRTVIAKRLSIPYWTVDADVTIPTSLFEKSQYAAYVIRPKLYKYLPEYLVPHLNLHANHAWHRPRSFEHFDVRTDVTQGWDKLDRTVPPAESFTGGSHAALKRLDHFIRHILPGYSARRNQPDIDGTTRLSPYLHFGHIGPIEILLAAQAALAKNAALQPDYDSLLNELLAWRELSVNFVQWNPHYDSIECAEPWARQSLAEHASDPRDPKYTLAQLEKGHTYDELWNASQLQMVHFGWMHNYMRMYWAKKILEWAPDPAQAFQWAVHLNDKYELDGRDPNGYAGVAWAIAGKHDRPWFDRPIFGKIRYMSGGSTGKKFNSKGYIHLVSEEAEQGQLW